MNRKKLLTVAAAILIFISAVLTAFGNSFQEIPNSGSESEVLEQMLGRAEAIVNYEWTPTQRIAVWNENPYNGKMYFEAGETVVGMPYTLFSWELNVDSLLSLEQFKDKVSENYSTTAYCNSVGATRTGPVFGSCCATFVSEVFGGDFMNGANPRYDGVGGIQNSPYGITYSNVLLSEIRPGDAVSNTTGSHIIWVGDISDTTITIYEQTPPVARKVEISKSSVDSSGYLTYNEGIYNIVTRSRALAETGEDYEASNKYSVPIKAYTINTGKTLVYSSVEGNVKANKIYDTDLCTIDAIFTNGWCHVSFPLDAGGSDSGYVKTSVFFDFDRNITKAKSKSQITTYRRSDLVTESGYVGNGDEIFIVGESDNAIQVLYPLIAGGYKISWIPIDKLSELSVEHMPGDINGDGVVNTKDLTRLMKYLSGKEVDVVSEAADVNGDGAVNGKDLTRLMKYISGEETEIY